MKFIFTDKDQTFKDEFQESRLSESTGWWTPEGEIYIWTKGTTRKQQIGIAVHESFEYIVLVKILRKRFRWSYNHVHWIANWLEWVASRGEADLSWELQDWCNQNWKR
jgi:hypothetical protein